MPFQLPSVAELEIQSTIKDVPGYVDPEDEDTWITVSFRQASEEQTIKRESFAQSPFKREWRPSDDDGDGAVYAETVDSYKPLGEQWVYDVYLTMSSCDILGRDGEPLFSFANTSDGLRVAGTFTNFKKAWGKLPTPVANAVHARCYEANPDWAPRSMAEAGPEETAGGDALHSGR